MRMREDGDHRAMLEAGKAWVRIKRSGQRVFADWTMVIGPALVRARHEAMAISGANAPRGRGYNEAFSALLQAYRLDDIEQVSRKDLFAIMEYLTAVNRWRDKQRAPTRFNHPTTIWRAFKGSDEYKAEQMARGEYKPPPDKLAPRAKPTLLEEAVALKEHVRDLEGQLQERTEERDSARDELARQRPEIAAVKQPAPDAPPTDDINAIIRQTLAGVHSFIRDRLGSDTPPQQTDVDNAHAIELMMDRLHEAMSEYPVETTVVDRAFWDIEEVFDFEDDPDKRAAHLQRIERLLEAARAAIAPLAEETLEQRPAAKPETGSPLTAYVVERGIPFPADKRGKRKTKTEAKTAAAADARKPSDPWIEQGRNWCLIRGEADRAIVHEVFQKQGRWQIRFKAATARRWTSVGYAYPTVEKAKEAAAGFAAGMKSILGADNDG
jgi:hypothetical protein